jgi:asparagine synthase (glutamine-hydrolysing)
LLADLKRALVEAVEDSINGKTSFAIAFSGGVDSSLLAKICKDLGKEITLLTVGFPESHDIQFSKRIASKMNLSHNIAELNKTDFQKNLGYIQQKIGCKNISHIENCIAYFYIAKLATENNFQLILTANGCDELFCGYNRYRQIYNQGKTTIMELIDEKIANELVLMEEISTMTKEFGVNIKQPFLSQKFISFAKNIPIDQKITSFYDFIRKHILREAALLVGVPQESAMAPKKALQYGSLIHKNLQRRHKNRITTRSNYIADDIFL